ncbi:MAG: outer membrane protein transport protein [Paraperlucidibaca sp.]
MMKIKSLALAIVAAVGTTSAFAGGFTLSEQSVSAMGTANAGRASNAIDASVVFSNPAAMGELKKAQFTQAVAFIDAKTKIKNVNAPFGGTTNGDIVPHTFIPSGFFTSGDQGGWAWGIAAYGSYGLKTNNEATFAGRHLGDKSSVKVMTIQPAISYQVNDKVSVGFGPTFNKADALLTKNVSSVPNIGGGLPGTVLGTNTLRGDDIGYGYNLGIHADLNDVTSVGFVYRSKVKYKIDDGTLETTGTGAPIGPGGALIGAAGTYSASTSLTTPESVEMSVTHKLNDKNTLHAGATWTRWSRLKELSVQTSHPIVGTTVETFNWKDSVGYAAGLTHACDDSLTLRAGLAYDNTPVAPEHRSVRLPSADRYIVSLGAGYKLSPTQTIDASYSYVQEETAEVRQAASGFSADYRNRANVYGLQFTQQF